MLQSSVLFMTSPFHPSLQKNEAMYKEQCTIKVMHNLKMAHRKKNFEKTKEMKQCETTMLRMGKMAS
jgi:hypothetical protein